MLTRLAVATVFVCLVILLASACGWGGGYNGPYIQPQEFVLYQTAPGDPPRIIGHGQITSTGPYATAGMEFFEIPCLDRPFHDLRSGQIDARTSSVELRSPPGSPAVITLSGPTLPLRRGDLAVELPFVGTLTPIDPCAGNVPLHLEARRGPDLSHLWNGRLPENAGRPANISLSLYQVRPNGRSLGTLWGELFMEGTSCGSFLQSSALLDPSNPRPAPVMFRLNTSSSATVTGLPSTLDPDPPASLNVTLTFTGGPCDARSFTATLN